MTVTVQGPFSFTWLEMYKTYLFFVSPGCYCTDQVTYNMKMMPICWIIKHKWITFPIRAFSLARTENRFQAAETSTRLGTVTKALHYLTGEVQAKLLLQLLGTALE